MPPNRAASAVSGERRECAGTRGRAAGGGAGRDAPGQRRMETPEWHGERRVIAATPRTRQWAGPGLRVLLFVYQHHLGPAPGPQAPPTAPPRPSRPPAPPHAPGMPDPSLSRSPVSLGRSPPPHGSLFISARIGGQQMRLSLRNEDSLQIPLGPCYQQFAFYSRHFGGHIPRAQPSPACYFYGLRGVFFFFFLQTWANAGSNVVSMVSFCFHSLALSRLVGVATPFRDILYVGTWKTLPGEMLQQARSPR